MSDAFELGLNQSVESKESTLSLLDLYSPAVNLPAELQSTPKTTLVESDTTGEGNAADSIWQNIDDGLHEFATTGVKHALLSSLVMNNALRQIQPGPGYSFYVGVSGVMNTAVSLMNLSQDAPKLFSSNDMSTRTQYGLQTYGDLLMLGGGIGMMFPQTRTAATIAEFTGIGVRWLTPLFFPDEKK